ncbi:glycoside hydrolase family 28 protein [Colletotrichum asianum]
MLFHQLIAVAAIASGFASALTDLGPVKGLNRRQAKSTQCVVPANGDGSDETPAILAAFDKCKTDGHIVFENVTYHIGQVMKTTDLNNVKIDIKGTLLWSKNTTYWLENSLPVGYQNQTTAWVLGGKHLDVSGFGYGTFDGNGQTWYDLVKGESNYPSLMLYCLTEQKIPSSRVFGLSKLKCGQSQSRGPNAFSFKIFTSTTQAPTGTQLVILTALTPCSRTTSTSVAGQLRMAMTALQPRPTTNILIEDVEFHDGQGVAIGSIGQYAGQFETIENVTVRNVLAHGSRYAGRIKTWTGEQLGYPPNGGGAGLGCWDNVTIYDAEQAPIYVMQCITYNGQQGNCSSSLFDISNISFTNFRGTLQGSRIAYLQCSWAHGGCDDVRIENMNFTNISVDPPTPATGYSCSNINDPEGFEC